MGLFDSFKDEEIENTSNNEVENPETNEREVMDNDSSDLDTFHEYQSSIQQEVNDAREISPEEIEKAKTRLLSTLNGNSYLAESYEKEFKSLKELDYPGKYKELINKVDDIKTITDIENLKQASEDLKADMYDSYKKAQKGAVDELQQIEQAGIVSRTKRQILLALEKDSYLAEKYQKQYEYIKNIDYIKKYQDITERVNEAAAVDEINALKREVQELKEQMELDVKKAPVEDLRMQKQREEIAEQQRLEEEKHQQELEEIRRQQEMEEMQRQREIEEAQRQKEMEEEKKKQEEKEHMSNIYDQLLEEDVDLACHMFGYHDDSKSALAFKQRGEDMYNEMLEADADELEELYSKRDDYLKLVINQAFFLKCLNIDTKINKLTKKEKKKKYSKYLKQAFEYSDDFKNKIRKKLSMKYEKADKEIPIWLLEDSELEERFLNTYCVSYRVNKLNNKENEGECKKLCVKLPIYGNKDIRD